MLDLTTTGFAELSCEEMTEVDGGITWSLIGSWVGAFVRNRIVKLSYKAALPEAFTRYRERFNGR